jgi:hypothetical protein
MHPWIWSQNNHWNSPTTRPKISRETVVASEFWMQFQKMFGPIALSGYGVEAGP